MITGYRLTSSASTWYRSVLAPAAAEAGPAQGADKAPHEIRRDKRPSAQLPAGRPKPLREDGLRAAASAPAERTGHNKPAPRRHPPGLYSDQVSEVESFEAVERREPESSRAEAPQSGFASALASSVSRGRAVGEIALTRPSSDRARNFPPRQPRASSSGERSEDQRGPGNRGSRVTVEWAALEKGTGGSKERRPGDDDLTASDHGRRKTATADLGRRHGEGGVKAGNGSGHSTGEPGVSRATVTVEARRNQ